MSECLFCQILKKEIPSKKIYEDDNVYAFEDIHPMAKVHWLFIHKKHSKDISEMCEDGQAIVDIFQAIKLATRQEGLEHSGYRVVTNLGNDGGQTVFHTHFHVLGGQKLRSFGA